MPLITPKLFEWSKWKRLRSADACILLTLIVRADRESFRAYPSIKKIATDTRTSSATVGRALKRLENVGCLTINRKIINEIKKGRSVVKRKNTYDLSPCRRFCTEKKDHRKKTKSFHSERSQKTSDVQQCSTEDSAVIGYTVADAVGNDQIEKSQNTNSGSW